MNRIVLKLFAYLLLVVFSAVLLFLFSYLALPDAWSDGNLAHVLFLGLFAIPLALAFLAVSILYALQLARDPGQQPISVTGRVL